jgi:hypothetical protein
MSNPTTESPSSLPAPNERHGCLTTYLVFIIIVNSILSLLYLFGAEWLRRNGPNTPDWAFWALAGCGFINVISAVALLRWRRWGFWLFIASAIAGLAINFSIGVGVQGAFGAVFGIAVLYGVLHIGNEKKAWPRLQ